MATLRPDMGFPRRGDQIELPMKDGSTARVVVDKVVWKQNEEGEYTPHIYCGALAEDDN